MSAKIEYPYTKEFYDTLSLYAKNRSENVVSILEMYKHCFKCLEEKDLETFLEITHNDFKKEPDHWFFIFHKSIRQTDFFDSVYRIDVENTLTEDEKKELAQLVENIFSENKRTSEEKDRYRLLNSKSRKETRESLGGHVDMILWNLIHVDSENLLESVLKATFDAVKFKGKKEKHNG